MANVFLDVCAGDAASHTEATKSHAELVTWLSSNATSYGLSSSNPASLTQEEQATVLEILSGDPSFAALTSSSLAPPPSLTLGKLVIELNDAACPRACASFRALCNGSGGVGKASGKRLLYKGVPFHRADATVLQGGDVVKGNGSAGDSIHGRNFKDEAGGLKLKHDGLGVVALANSGKNTNSSGFYVCLKALPQLDKKYVVVGRVVNDDGLRVLERVRDEVASTDGAPKVACWIGDCGEKS